MSLLWGGSVLAYGRNVESGGWEGMLAVPLAIWQCVGPNVGGSGPLSFCSLAFPEGHPGEKDLPWWGQWVGSGGRGTLCRGPSPMPRVLCPPGCYPRCPEDRPVYDEDLKRCVTADQCGCYVGDTRYPPGAPVPSEEDCQSWYPSSARWGLGVCRTRVHTYLHAQPHARADTEPHGHAEGAGRVPVRGQRTWGWARGAEGGGWRPGGREGPVPVLCSSTLAFQRVCQHLESLPARRR